MEEEFVILDNCMDICCNMVQASSCIECFSLVLG
jgi:hypothetical protein